MRFNVSFAKRLLLLVFTFVVGFAVVAGITSLLMLKMGADSTPALRIGTVLQDIFMFIVPAIATALVITRQPATLLAIDRKVPWKFLLLGIGIYAASYPIMELVIYLNAQLPLPQRLAEYFWSMENTQAATAEAIFGPRTIPDLIMSLLIVGVMAGLSEELLFRGALQRILGTGRLSPGAAIWVAAIVFSLMHFQPYGFFPRLLLGALFGYMLHWSRCLWVPVILHIANNSVAIVSVWAFGTDISADGIAKERVISPMFLTVCAISLALTIWLLARARQEAIKEWQTNAVN